MSKTMHWGEIPDENKSTYVPDVSADIEKSMNNPSEFDSRLPNEKSDPEHLENLVLKPMDPMVHYAILLHKHVNEMQDLMRSTDFKSKRPLPIPVMPVIHKKHVRNCFNYIPIEHTPFTNGDPVIYPEISSTIAKQVLTKCAATMFAHVGYETTHKSLLLILSDVLEQFLLKISLKFKTAREDEIIDGLGGFPCFPEKVLIEMGMGGLKGLHDYYQNRIIKYINVLHKRSRDSIADYEKALIPKIEPTVEIKNEVITVVKDDVVEMHFPGTDGKVDLSSLETGYQLLNSLEAETNFAVVKTEELNVESASPSRENETIMSPFSKKKWMK